MSSFASSRAVNGTTNRTLALARVLLVHGDLASRLALQTILEAGGYAVDVAATPAEALARLDDGEYELVLTDSKFGAPRAGLNVLAYARVKEYHPATAMVNSYEPDRRPRPRSNHQISIYTENLPRLLADVAELIGVRASRRHHRLLQKAV
jgi:CheY-like chemotaxis protein